MKYEIKYNCGHTGIVNLTGTNKEREKRLDYLKQCDCPTCNKAKNNAMFAEYENKNNLPLLAGTEKQIVWARQIRIDTIKAVEEFMGQFKEDEQTIKFMNWLKEQNKAEFWINIRNYDAKKIAWLWKNEMEP